MAWENVGNWLGGIVEDGMAGYFEVEKVKAATPEINAAIQDATFDSPEVDENPTAQPNQSVAATAPAVPGGGLLQNQTAMYVVGGLALVGAVLLIKGR